MLNDSTNSYTDSFKVAFFLFKWRKTLIMLGVVAAVLSAIFSSPIFVTPLYRSTVIMYPASSNSISKSLLNENAIAKQDILEFGEDEQTEQMLQILNSNRIRDRVISKFKLAEHYGIEPGSRYHQTRLYDRFESYITYKRTEFMAVKVSVLDKDPQMAADIANEIAALLDSVKNDMQKERAMQGFKIVEAEYLSLKAEVRTMEDSLTQLRKLGVHDYETQAEMMNQQLAMEIAKGNTRGIKALDDKLSILATYGGPYVSIRDGLEHEKKQLSYIKARYEEAKIDAFQEIPQKFVVENAYKAERKAYPMIWVVVILSTLGTLLAGMLVIFMVERSPEFLLKLKQTYS
ncbi:MAG: Wzz/FepE/Etk N-terminal domain-containing protein [Bacteroidota bacterium]